MLVDTNQFFKCETCTHNKVNGCDTFCNIGESYHPSIQKLMPINDGDFLMREEVIQEVLSQMTISSSPEAMKARLSNLQGVSIQKHGEWVLGHVPAGYCTPGGNRPWVCSECGTVKSWRLDKPEDNFCPKCGADMQERMEI